jgi:hypothetical protein
MNLFSPKIKKTMQKIIMLLVAGIFTFQATKAQFGIQAGVVGVPGEAFPTADGNDKLGGATGYTFGIFYQMPVGEKFVFQPGINLLNKGWKDDLDGVEITTMKINYLEMPLQMVYTGGKDKGFFIGAGPSLLFGLGGTYKIERSNGPNVERDYEFGGNDTQEGGFTLGLNAMAGYNFGKFMIGVNYGMGISNRDVPANAEFQDFGNQSHFALRVGYLFKK